MKHLFTALVTSFILGSGACDVHAQCHLTSSGTWVADDGGPCVNTLITSVPFLRIIPDARSAAMGDVGIGLSADPNAMHFNASKLAFAREDMGISATYSPWLRSIGLPDVYMAYLSGFKKVSTQEAVGVSLRYFSLGEIAFTDDNGQSLGTGHPNEFELSVGYARKLADHFSAAVTGKFIYSNLAAGQQVDDIDITAGTAGAVDISLTYKTEIPLGEASSGMTIGAAITNLGSKISYTHAELRDFLPANFGIGGAWDVDFDDYNRLTIAADINKLLVPTPQHPDNNPDFDKDGDGVCDCRQKSWFSGIFGSWSDAPNGFSEELQELMFSFGAEYWYDRQFAIRAGYYYENPLKGNRRYLTAGLGLKYNIFGLNVSYLIPTSNQRSPLDNTLRFSLLFDFDGIEEVAPGSSG